MRINNQKQNNFKGLNNALGMFYNPNAALPTLVIETGVTLGRAKQANKRGGKQEATERLVEQGVSALVWVYGVQILKKAGEFVGKNILGFKDLEFDVGHDFLRNPIKNNKINAKTAGFKVGNILLSTAIATYFIGFVLPKINHKISSKVVEKEKKEQTQQEQKQELKTTLKPMNLEEYKNNSKKSLAFTSLVDKGISLAHILENNQTARLLITDTGVVGGRFYNSRNKYEKIESLFRDISSIYFYLLSSSHVVKMMNKLTNNTDINPKVSDCTVEHLIKNINKKGRNIDKFNFARSALGEVGLKNNRKLDEIFKDKKMISVEEFIKIFPDFKEKAKQMATLQPIFEGSGVLTKTQAQDVLSSGWVTNPEFLKKAMDEGTFGAASNKLKFVSHKKLENIRKSIDGFVEQISEYANKKDVKIDENLIKKIAKQNKIKNLGFNALGVGVAIFFLSYVIPKIQYFITKKLTNEDKFPGAVK